MFSHRKSPLERYIKFPQIYSNVNTKLTLLFLYFRIDRQIPGSSVREIWLKGKED